MRKALIAAVVAAVLFAVGAFAATFALTSEDVASDNDLVERCAATATVDFTTGEYSTTLGDFPVTGATVEFVAENGLATNACDDSDARLAIRSGNTWTDYGSATVDNMEADFTINPGIAVGPINEVAVVVEGFSIPAGP